MRVQHTHWTTHGVHAHCTDCDWRAPTAKQASVVAKVTRHVQATGHTVYLGRDQSRVSYPPQS